MVKDELRNDNWQEASKKYHNWWFSPNENRLLFTKQDDAWRIGTIRRVHRQTRAARQTFSLTPDVCPTLPEDAVPATVIQIRTQIKVSGLGTMVATLVQEIVEEYDWQKYGWPTRQIVMPDDAGEEFALQIQQGQGQAIRDGSYKTGRSSSAYKSMNTKAVKGYNIIPGRSDDQSSYRGELGGILGIVVMAKAVCRKHSVNTGSLEIGCDNIGALKAISGGRTPNCRWNSYDIISAIKHEMETSNITWTFKHVTGHQDDKKTYDELDEWAQANVWADKEAKAYLTAYVRMNCPVLSPIKVKGQRWKLRLNGQGVTKNVNKAIYNEKWK